MLFLLLMGAVRWSRPEDTSQSESSAALVSSMRVETVSSEPPSLLARVYVVWQLPVQPSLAVKQHPWDDIQSYSLLDFEVNCEMIGGSHWLEKMISGSKKQSPHYLHPRCHGHSPGSGYIRFRLLIRYCEFLSRLSFDLLFDWP